MRINIPLLPMLVEVRLRPIPVTPRWRPLAPFRFSLRGLMIAVVVAGLHFSLCAHLVRINRASLYHAEQAYRSYLSRQPKQSPFPLGPLRPPTWKGKAMIPPGAPPLETWHREMSRGYTADIKRLFPLASGLFITFVTLGAVAAFGRVIHALFSTRLRPGRG